MHYDIIICILLFDLSHLLPFTVVNVGYQSTLPATCPGVTMFPHFPMKYSEKYRNTEIQKYKNTKTQKYKYTKIQKFKNTKKYKNTKTQKHKNTKVQNTKIQQ